MRDMKKKRNMINDERCIEEMSENKIVDRMIMILEFRKPNLTQNLVMS